MKNAIVPDRKPVFELKFAHMQSFAATLQMDEFLSKELGLKRKKIHMKVGIDVDKRAIIKGINNVVAGRIAKLAGSAPLEEKVFVDGGPASNRGLVESLEDALLCDIEVTQFPQFTVALGGANLCVAVF